MKGLSSRIRWLYFSFFVLAFVVTIPVLALYATGYRMGEGFSIVETGGLFVGIDVSGAKVYVDGELKYETGFFQRNFFLQNLKPGKHEVAVMRDIDWPWKKTLNIYEKEVTQVGAFLFPVKPQFQPVTKFIETVTGTTSAQRLVREENSEYPIVVNLFAATSTKKTIAKVPVKTATTTPVKDEIIRKKMRAWKEGANVYVAWMGGRESLPPFFCEGVNCVDKIRMPAPNGEIISWFDFYPGREDVLLVTVSSGVYAVEVDGRSGHITVPVYVKPAADFRVNSSETLYIRESGTYFRFIE